MALNMFQHKAISCRVLFCTLYIDMEHYEAILRCNRKFFLASSVGVPTSLHRVMISISGSPLSMIILLEVVTSLVSVCHVFHMILLSYVSCQNLSRMHVNDISILPWKSPSLSRIMSEDRDWNGKRKIRISLRGLLSP